MPAEFTLYHPSSVVVLEDDQTMLDLICMVLKKHGIQTVPCFNNREATLALRENPEVSSMLVDLSLPDGDRLDVQRTSGHLGPGLPCFMQIANNSVESGVQAMKAGARDYFTKPFDTETMVANRRRTAQRLNVSIHTVYHMIRCHDLVAV